MIELSSFADRHSLLLPPVPEWADPVWHLFVIRHPDRNGLQNELNEAGIGTLIHYPVPIHQSQAYSEFNQHQLPLASELASTVLSLPIGPQLDVGDVVKVVKALVSVHSTRSED